MSNDEFRATYRGTAVMRAKRRGLARNAAIALGNIADADDIPVLETAVRGHDEPLVRAHAAWALGQVGNDRSRALLSEAHRRDPEPEVRDEARRALEGRPADTISLRVVT